jgi:hypothetical protein
VEAIFFDAKDAKFNKVRNRIWGKGVSYKSDFFEHEVYKGSQSMGFTFISNPLVSLREYSKGISI